jgi:enoyl-CoA hydratase
VTPLRTEAGEDGVLVITIDRPEVRNAVDRDVAEGIAAALERLDAEEGLRAAVLTGAGNGFCAGMDLKAFAAGELPYAADRGFAGIVRRPPAKPIIAAVEGFAVAGGLEIALACDLIVAGESARLGVPEVKRGLVAAGGALLRLPRRVPYGRALELLLTGDLVHAPAALQMGLVDRVVGDGEALAAARELAATIARNGPLAVAATKRVIEQARDWPLDEFFDRQEAIVAPVRSSEDAREGAAAFVEKRSAVWRGR